MHSGFTVTTWNLLHAMPIPPKSGATLYSAMKLLTEEISSDLIAIQEVDVHQSRSGNGNQVKEIAEIMGAKYWAFAPSMYGTPGEKWEGIKENIIFDNSNPPPNREMYGIGIVSKIPVRKWHRINLGKAPLGMPLLIAGEKRANIIYVSDEPRSALVAELENGISVTTTHLSFVPVKNVLQLKKITKWLDALSGVHILTGDFNLPWGLASRFSGWSNLVAGPTYPSWKPALEFDYIMSKELKRDDVLPKIHSQNGISDHLASSITIR